MSDNDTLNALQRVEDALAKASPVPAYRDVLIAVLRGKRFTVGTAKTIAQKRMLLCTIRDMNLALALKFGLNIHDLNLLSDDDNLRRMAEELDSDAPQPLLNEEIKTALRVAKSLVKEITALVETRPDLADALPIALLFDSPTQRKTTKLLHDSFRCFKFQLGIAIDFIREDGSHLAFTSELAVAEWELRQGLSWRPYLPPNAGMWYDNGHECTEGYLTQNTMMPLSVAYIKSDGQITEIVDRVADDPTMYYNKEPGRYVLEVHKGWFAKNRIRVGDIAVPKTILADCSVSLDTSHQGIPALEIGGTT